MRAFTLRQLRFSTLLPTDRFANVTRHRRAPAGRPSAGVRADGSSGPAGSPLWPGGLCAGESPDPFPCVPPGPPDLKRDRDAPSVPAVLHRSPLRRHGSPARGYPPAPSQRRLPANMMFLKPCPHHLAHRRCNSFGAGRRLTGGRRPANPSQRTAPRLRLERPSQGLPG